MKSACFVRKVDRLGRVVLPAELRHELNIAEQDNVEVQISGTSLVIQKYEQACVFSGHIGLSESVYLPTMPSFVACFGITRTYTKVPPSVLLCLGDLLYIITIKNLCLEALFRG